MTMQTGPPELPERGTVGMDGMYSPAIARYWWLTELRGLVALALGVAVAVAGRGSARLVTFLALFWLTGGSHHAAVRPGASVHVLASGWDWQRPSTGRGAVLVLVRDWLSGPWTSASARWARRGAHRRAADLRRVRCRGVAAAGRSAGSCSAPLELALGASLLLTSGVDSTCWCRSWSPGAVSGILLHTQYAAAPLRTHLAAGTGNAAPGSL